jgi:succinoglycan biosynthesis protein ExoM
MTGGIDVDICICTFQRPQVGNTLRSVAGLVRQSHWHVHVIVADNDDTPSARPVVEATARETGLSVTYLHAPARNISIARNACLEAATAPLVAFLDDDELATPHWLAALLAAMEQNPCDAVLGPVRAVYDPDGPDWLSKGDFHSTWPVWVGGQIRTGYAGNVLLRREAPSVRGLRFRDGLGRTGGEDTLFFAAMVRAGGRIAYAAEAVVTEEVPPERARLAWLLRRRFRFGQTHALLLLEADGQSYPSRMAHLVKATAKASVCCGMALLHVVNPERTRYWLLRGTLHAGAVSGLLRPAEGDGAKEA